jgi:TIR domain-containing protein
MAIGTEKLQVQSPDCGSPPAAIVKESSAEEKHSVHVRETAPIANASRDLCIFHNSTDGNWTSKLVDRLRRARFGDRNLRLLFAGWNPTTGANVLAEMGSSLRGHRLLAIVVSRKMLEDDWRAAQRSIELLNEVAPSEWQVVIILKDNVTIPLILRLGEWFDFRNENQFEESISDLLSFLREDVTSSRPVYSFGVSSAKERILSNLFPIVEVTKFVYSAETRFDTESELMEACHGAGPLPFLVKESRLYTVERLSPDSSFAPAVTNWGTHKQENFTEWLSSQDRAEWAIELLNSLFRQHAWKRGLRWDTGTDQFYFPRTKPKSVWWQIGGQTISREVTAPHMGWIDLGNQVKAEVQYGWRHQSIRADFVQVLGNLFLRLEPSWLLTELDGKTATTTQPIGPLFSGPEEQERNGQVLRSLRFWSSVLAKGHHEIRINTGQAPVRAKLTPLSGFSQFGIPSDRLNYDLMMHAEMEDDLLMPALCALGQESLFNDEEGVSSATIRSFRSEQS